MRGFPFELEGDFIVKRTGREGIYLILAFVPGDLWRDGVLWVIKKLKRKIAFPLLTQKEFKEAITSIGARYEGSEIVVRYVASEPKTLKRKPKKLYPLTRRDGEQEGVTLNEAFETVMEDERRITSLRFKVKKSFRTICSGTVTPKCQFICKRGASLFSETALTRMINFAFQKFELIRGRSRKDHPGYKVTPITLKYETEAFPDLETGKEFIDSMRKLPNASCTVIHGNPYIHLSIADYTDGSSYRILILDPKEITIVPQLKASEGSLSRLISHIFEGFKEGEVVEDKSVVV